MEKTQMTQSEHGTCNTNTRSRGWLLTINNPRPEDTEYFKNIVENAPKDLIEKCSSQLEKGENETEHIQAFIYYKNPRKFNTIKKKFPRAHIETAKDKNKAYNYCKKENTRIEGPWIYPVVLEACFRTAKAKWHRPTWDEFREMFIDFIEGVPSEADEALINHRDWKPDCGVSVDLVKEPNQD